MCIIFSAESSNYTWSTECNRSLVGFFVKLVVCARASMYFFCFLFFCSTFIFQMERLHLQLLKVNSQYTRCHPAVNIVIIFYRFCLDCWVLFFINHNGWWYPNNPKLSTCGLITLVNSLCVRDIHQIFISVGCMFLLCHLSICVFCIGHLLCFEQQPHQHYLSGDANVQRTPQKWA